MSKAEYFKKIVFPEQDEYFVERSKHPRQNYTVKGVMAKEYEENAEI